MFAFVHFTDYMVNTKRKKIIYIYIYICICMVYVVFITDGFFEVAIETWSE